MRIATAAHFAAAAALLASSCVFVVHDQDDCASDWNFTSTSPEHRGSGTPAREEREVPEFTRLEVGGAIHVDVRIGSPRSVAVRGDDNLIGHVRTEVADGSLRLSMRPGSYETRTQILVEVVTPSLAGLVLDGAAKASVEELAGGTLSVTASGAADVALAGQVDTLRVNLSGAADLEAFALDAGVVDIDQVGASEAEVAARTELSADVSGAGKLRYRGDPARLRTEATGAGQITESPAGA